MKPQIRKIETLYWFGDIVYLRVADEECRGMITRVEILPGNAIRYEVAWGGETEWKYEMELTTEYVPDYVKESSD